MKSPGSIRISGRRAFTSTLIVQEALWSTLPLETDFTCPGTRSPLPLQVLLTFGCGDH